MPFAATVKCVNLGSFRNKVTRGRTQRIQRTLYPVIYAADKARTQLNGKRFSPAPDRRSRPQARGVFVYLYPGGITLYPDDFAYQPELAHENEFQHLDALNAPGFDNRPHDTFYLAHDIFSHGSSRVLL